MTSEETPNSPQYNVREWFNGLSSGRERAAAIAITDKDFINMFVDIAHNKHIDNNVVGFRRVTNLATDPKKSSITENMSVMQKDLASTTSPIDKLPDDSKAEVAEESDTLVRQTDCNADDKMNLYADVKKDNMDQNTSDEKAPSTAFRIQSKNSQEEEKMEQSSTTRVQEKELRTTLHFDSGLALPVSSTAEIAIVNNASKITSNTRECKSESILTKSKLTEFETANECSDVHEKLHFSALKISTIPSLQCRISGNKKKQKELILRSKLSASRALLPNLSATAKATANTETKLLRHVRLVFRSALAVVDNTLVHDDNSENNGIEVLTLDPSYLQSESESGSQFLYDAQQIINSLHKKQHCTGLSTTDFTKSPQFLNNRIVVDEGSARTKVSWPEWLLPVVESKDLSVQLLLIFLAKVELSIQESHQTYIKAFEGLHCVNDSPRNLCSRRANEELNLAPESIGETKVDVCTNLSSSQTITSPVEVDAVHSNAAQEVTNKVPCVDVIYRQTIKPLYMSTHQTIPPVEEHFRNILKTWANLQSETDSSHPVNAKIKELFSSEKSLKINIEDLLLVPLSLVTSPTSTHMFDKRRQEIRHLAQKWNQIISLGLSHVPRTMFSGSKDKVTDGVRKEENELDTIDGILGDDALLFKNEFVKASSGKKKKKKKRKRKRKLAHASKDATADTCQNILLGLGDGKSGGVGSSSSSNYDTVNNEGNTNPIVKVVCELSNDINILRNAESSLNAVSKRAVNDRDEKLSENKANISHGSSNGGVTTLNTNLKVSLVNGVNGTCVVGGGRLEEDEHENNDAWETVEPKGGRGNSRRKASPDSHSANSQQQGSGRKNKSKTKGSSRQRTSQRRKAKDGMKEASKDNVKVTDEILLEPVDEEIEKRQKVVPNVQKKERNLKQNSEKSSKQRVSPNSLPHTVSPGQNTRVASCRDVVMGNITTNPPARIPTSRIVEGSAEQVSSKNSLTNLKLKHVSQTNVRKGEFNTKSKTHKTRSMLSVDQNTATTVPDTIYGLSAATPSTSQTDEHDPQFVRRGMFGIKGAVVSNSKSKAFIRNSDRGSSGSSTSGKGDMHALKLDKKVSKSAAPLLQTVIGPRDVDSTKSSVASSLEASREDDVGYHLLKSCERLSDDMVTFMDRRAIALHDKRRERTLLLAALQDTLQSIWAGRCHPEIYGSCATKLDLPSSDLDVVVRELEEDCSMTRITPKHHSSDSSMETYLAEMDANFSDGSLDSPSHTNSYQRHFYPPLTKNGQRVLRLARELETRPWAVQVNPIPTASVPVLKILADPSRLPGATAGMDWMIHHQHMAAAAAAEMNSTRSIQQKDKLNGASTNDQTDFCRPPAGHLAAISGMSSPPYRNASVPWRGADVMHGLLSLDITFEGTEHGGLGSTIYTNRVVDEACRETGLSPESTPAVQVLVVIKELLAQRKLNEPFSGGLSSYAVLLLVVALMKERRIIKQEMDRMERQRRAVASETNASITGMQQKSSQSKKTPFMWHTPKKQPSSKSILPADNGSTKGNSDTKMDTTRKDTSTAWDNSKATLTKISSWAAIAKKSVNTNNVTEKSSISRSNCKKDAGKSTIDPSGNFCDNAVKKIALNTVRDKPGSNVSEAEAEKKSENTEMRDAPLFPQGSNDVLEVLCSGEPTAGKLLMHFLLFYGRHFDAQTTCIDLGKNKESSNELSPFRPRKTGGFYNPVTEVYTVDHVVVYDPWEESDSSMNVARSCFAWGNIRTIFEQCFNTLSGVVERGNGTSSADRNGFRSSGCDKSTSVSRLIYGGEESSLAGTSGTDIGRDNGTDNVAPLLELLLSF